MSAAQDAPIEVRIATRSASSINLLDVPLAQARAEFERIYFRELLAIHGGNIRKVSGQCGMERTHVYRKLKMLGLRDIPEKIDPQPATEGI